MNWLVGILIFLGSILLLGAIPLGVRGRYDENGPFVQLLLGPIRWQVYPRKKKKVRKKKKEKEAAKKKEKTEKKGGSFRDFIPLIRLIFNFLGDFCRRLRVKHLQLDFVLAGSDPCDLAVNYGKLQRAVAGLDPQLERFFVIRKKRIHIGCDFEADQTRVLADIALTVTVGRLLALGGRYGVKAIREFMKMKNKSKGGTMI